uniref:PilT domain protein n=2 Tax=Candidatus Bipolaricaulota TaxID=67810 RepID=H5SPT8_9BACT|nr:PilT domain protein [uncultured Acetothermia bacterium]BAL58174.1 PilT domain protein [uncultured Acetothermia bacterium]BAL59914.1 PilT domain protein [Candidatus Acetothermum autotrophicum]
MIAHLRGRLSLHDLLRDYESIYVSAITLYELEYGAIKAGRASDFAHLAQALQPTVLAVGRLEAEQAAHLNGMLARKNQQIGPRDALIAGTALQWGLDLLTLNVNEFKRVPNLSMITPSNV